MMMVLRTLVFALSVFALAVPPIQAMVPVDLRCDGNTDPIATTLAPVLSWRVESTDRGATQSAWQIIVASTPDLLRQGEGDLWNSGKVSANRSPQIRYAGKPLAVGQVCHWKIRSWETEQEKSDGAATWSKPAFWEIAPNSPADWLGAQWIDDGKAMPTDDAAFYEMDPAPRMRHEFSLSKPIAKARLHVAGLGWYTASLNGSRVGDHELDPAWTAFEKRVLFSSFDVTQQLQSGDNCIGIELGNGWFNPLPLRMWGHRNIRGSIYTGRPRAIACLVVDHSDGTQSRIVTGPDWKFAQGPTLFNSVYLGEIRDARLNQPGWNTPDFDAATWKPVRPLDTAIDAPLDPLIPLAMPPIRAGNLISAFAVTHPEPGVQIVDFGENFTGVPEINLEAPAGTTVRFRFGELLFADGTLNPMTSACGQIKGSRKLGDGTIVPRGGPGAPTIAWQADQYTCQGDGPETYRPKFTFHGFRYMEVIGLPQSDANDGLSPADVKGIPLRSDFVSIGSFSCSNERLNAIQEMTRRTFLANVVSVQSDCPHRERFGYGGDIAATSEAYLMNFDMAGFYAKTVRDWADAARPNGNLTDTAPFVGIQYCGVGWAMAHPLLLEQLYQHYGNRSLLEEQLPVAIRWLELENKARKNGLVTKGLGDHEALSRSGGPVITTAMFVDAARRVARMARIVRRDSDASRFDAMADDAASVWEKSFLNTSTGKVAEGSQTQQSLALGFGPTPIASRQAVFDQLVLAIESPIEVKGPGNHAPSKPHLTTGIFGTRFVMEELSKNGRSDLAYSLANRKTLPSWGWMLENDATTLWEHWAGSDGTFSNNHPMFGSVSAWFFRWLGGIQVAPEAVGADRLVICPQVVPGLDWVKCSHQTVRGLVESNWKSNPQTIELEIVIPPDTAAEIELPIDSEMITESGLPLREASGIEVLIPRRRLKVGSGHYQFKLQKKKQTP